jgi:hypothetical protein
MRQSTTYIDYRRQNVASTGSFTVNLEGMNGRASLDGLEKRSTIQMKTAEALVCWAIQNRDGLIRMVPDAKEMVIGLAVQVSIRQ